MAGPNKRLMRKLMLIEDDETMLSLLRTLLQFEGFEVVVLSNEKNLDEIMRTMRREKPEVILLDVYLRHHNGFDLIDKIRQDPQLKDTQVLMSSGTDFRTQCIRRGADGFLLKPYMPDELINMIKEKSGG
jgi:DNA-binding response OmpR family regulator